MTKIEIGSGKMPHRGYTTIDIEPSNKPDIVGDFRTMSFSGIEEIRSHHLLEHFNNNEAERVLEQWCDWLKVGGRLIVETPDLETMCSVFGEYKYYPPRSMMAKLFFGSQEAGWAYHRSGWYEDKFREVLPRLGFNIVLIKKKHSYIRDENNNRYRLPNIMVIADKL